MIIPCTEALIVVLSMLNIAGNAQEESTGLKRPMTIAASCIGPVFSCISWEVQLHDIDFPLKHKSGLRQFAYVVFGYVI